MSCGRAHVCVSVSMCDVMLVIFLQDFLLLQSPYIGEESRGREDRKQARNWMMLRGWNFNMGIGSGLGLDSGF